MLTTQPTEIIINWEAVGISALIIVMGLMVISIGAISHLMEGMGDPLEDPSNKKI